MLLEYAQSQQMMIDEFIGAEVSSTQGIKERRVDELLSKMKQGDSLLVAELSRLGRNMLQTLNIINELSEKGINLIFVRQPELSTNGPHTKLLMAIYSYFAEAEREYISIRTKQGLAAAKAKGKNWDGRKVAEIKNVSLTSTGTRFWIIYRWVSTWQRFGRLSTIS